MADTLPLPIEHSFKVAAASWGQPIASTPCPTCGTETEEGAIACHVCGHTFHVAYAVKAKEHAEKQNTGMVIALIIGFVLFAIWCSAISSR